MLDTLLKHTVKEISPKKAFSKKNAVYLDARPAAEYNVSHLPNAIRIGFKDFNAAGLSGISKKGLLIVYCSVGYRSEKISEKLIASGFKNVQNLYGGIFEWSNQGFPLQDSVGATHNVHAYNKDWGKWLQSGTKKYN